jgi:hypothetical protein
MGNGRDGGLSGRKVVKCHRRRLRNEAKQIVLAGSRDIKRLREKSSIDGILAGSACSRIATVALGLDSHTSAFGVCSGRDKQLSARNWTTNHGTYSGWLSSRH